MAFDAKTNRLLLLALALCFVLLSLALFIGTVRSLSSISEERQSQRDALEMANEQTTQLRAVSVARITSITEQLTNEQAEGDRAEQRAAKYEQQLLDAGITPSPSEEP